MVKYNASYKENISFKGGFIFVAKIISKAIASVLHFRVA